MSKLFTDPEWLGNTLLSLLDGTTTTLWLFAVTLLFALPMGFGCSLLSLSRKRFVRRIISFYTWIVRGSPLLLQLIFWYFGLNVLGVKIEREMAAAVGFIFNYTAYYSEIFRGGIQSMSKGQYEAADVLGMTHTQTMRHVILPQVVKRVLPSVGNEVLTLIKDTALVYGGLGMADLLHNSQRIMVRDYDISPLILAMIFYLVMTAILTRVLKAVENRFNYYR